MKTIALCATLLFAGIVSAQETPPAEKRVALTEAAVALDATGLPTLQGTLSTTTLNGAPDIPVTNIRMIVKNVSNVPLAFVSGLVTFYDAAGVRCGEGLFKADAVATGESFETDTPGIRIRCVPATWRIVATNLVPRLVPSTTTPAPGPASRNFIINVDGEEHPIQLDKPMVLKLGDKQRMIVVRQVP